MKKIISLALAVFCVLTLTACGCKHETWIDADCVTPKTCAECGEIEGAPLGHSWMAATCTTPKTCEICAATDGEPRDHIWTDATCATPKTCSTCGETEGETLEHIWEDATTDAPKTCTGCGLTEGERIITDPRFITSSTKGLQGTWFCTTEMDSETVGDEHFEGSFTLNIFLEFTNDGHFNIYHEAADMEAFAAVMRKYMENLVYANLIEEGSLVEGDEAAKESYKPFLDEFLDENVTEEFLLSVIEDMNYNLVYYVEDYRLYYDPDWSDDMYYTTFVLANDTLIINDLGLDLGLHEDDLTLTRVTE